MDLPCWLSAGHLAHGAHPLLSPSMQAMSLPTRTLHANEPAGCIPQATTTSKGGRSGAVLVPQLCSKTSAVSPTRHSSSPSELHAQKSAVSDSLSLLQGGAVSSATAG